MIAHTDPLSHLALAAAGVLLVWWAGTRAGPQHLGRTVALAGGVIGVLVALSPPVEAAADRTYTAHMVQHLLLILVASPLLAAGLPSGAPHSHRPSAAQRRRWRSAAPLLATAAFAVTLAATHLTAWYGVAVEVRVVHDLEHAAYLGSAVALWYALTRAHGAVPATRVLAAFGVMAVTALVGTVLITADSPLVDAYARRLGEQGALADQRAAAALMWTTGVGLALPLLVLSVWRWASAEQRRAERAEALLDVTPPIDDRTIDDEPIPEPTRRP